MLTRQFYNSVHNYNARAGNKDINHFIAGVHCMFQSYKYMLNDTIDILMTCNYDGQIKIVGILTCNFIYCVIYYVLLKIYNNI